MANDRIYYAMQQVSFKKDSGGSYTAAKGVQDAGTTTNFSLEPVFTMGQLAVYENIEGIPDVEVTLSKLLDGNIPLFCLATADQTDGPELVKRVKAKTFVQLGIWDETLQSVGEGGASASTYVDFSGLYTSSSSFSFPLEGNFTEDLTLVGNSKIWGADVAGNTGTCNQPYSPSAAAGAFAGNNATPPGSGGVNRRENMLFATTVAQATGSPDYTILPSEIPGIGSNGQLSYARISNINVSVDITRTDLFTMGQREPYAKTTEFPISVSCDIEVTSTSGDLIDAINACASPVACETASNLSPHKIRIATCEGLRVYLGSQNKLSSVTYGGASAGGGNATVTYSYETQNDYTIMHSGDVSANGGSASGSGWWAARSSYLGVG